MGEFGIRTVEITKNANQIGEISNVIGAAHGKVLNVLDNLGGIGLGEISAPIECIEAKLVKCKSETLSLSSSLGKIVKLYLLTDESIANTNLQDAIDVNSMSLDLLDSRYPGVPPQYQVLMNEDDFFDNVQEQFGFDDRTMDIMEDVYDAIKEKYGSHGQNYVDWMFFRALSQLGGYDDDDLSGINDAVNPWKNGAGNAYDEMQHEDFFVNQLGLSESDYNYLRYNLRIQNQLTSSPSTFNSTCVYSLTPEKREKWRTSMAVGLGFYDLTDQQMQSRINEMYNMYNGKGDFAHMCYTLAGNLNHSWNGVDNTWNPLTDYGWFDEKSRKDVVGWLGDATIPTDNGSVSFGNDDYIADLDADNIAHRVDYDSGVTAMEAFNNYYDDMNNSNDADAFRGNEFLQNNSYEDVEDVILNNLGCFTYEDLENNSNYADALRFLERLKALQ